MSRIIQLVTALFVTVFRCAALVVALMLIIFPAYKEVWHGYVPILLGALLAWALARYRPLAEGLMGRLPEVSFWLLMWGGIALVQGTLIALFRSQPTFDGLFVYQQALTFAETGRMDPLTYYAPGQIWYYGLFFRWFGASPELAQWIQIPLAALIPTVVYLMVRSSIPTARARWIALLVAVYPGFVTYILVTPYYYYLYTLMILCVAWSWLKVEQRGRYGWIALAGGLAAGWGALTKATLLVAPIQGLFYWVITSGRLVHRRVIWATLLFAVGMVVVITPWQIRNYRVFGENVLICTSGPLVFYSANNPESDGLYSDIPDRVQLETPQDMLDHMAWCNEQAREFIREEPIQFIQLVGSKILHTWGTETTFVELINWRGNALGPIDPALRMVVQTGWAALVFAWSWIALRALRRRMPPTRIELLAGIVVLSKFLIYSVYEGGARHHLPAVPLLIACVLMMVASPDRDADTTAR